MAFNGPLPEDYESFAFPGGQGFASCKTGKSGLVLVSPERVRVAYREEGLGA